MIKNYLLITLRGMTKNKMFIVINVFGMGIALAIGMVAFLAFQYDNTFDDIHKNKESIYRISAVREFESKISRVGCVPLPLGNIVGQTFSDVDRFTRYVPSSSNFKLDDNVFQSSLTYVDPDFFEIFSWTFVAGQPSALKDKSSVFISKDMAVRLFRSPQEALGKTIRRICAETIREVKIAGVFEEPAANSSFYKRDGSTYMNFDNYKDEFGAEGEINWRREATLFVQIKNVDAVAPVAKQLQQYVVNNNKEREDFQIKEFALDPFSTMAHRDRDEEARVWTWGAPPVSAVIGSVIMAFLLLLIACFNLTNTAVAISSRRLKEIGIRKVMGSMRMQLIIQFIGETTVVCLIALFVGLGIVNLFVDGWNIMTGNNIFLTSQHLASPGFVLFLACSLLFTGVLAGSYPAFYISKFEPVTILKGKLKFGGTNYFTRVLLGLQFAFSLISIVSSIGFFQNSKYQREYDLGFNARGSVIVPVNGKQEFDTYKNALSSNPMVWSIAGASSGIFSNRSHEVVKFESRQTDVDVIAVGDNYLITLGLELLEGRDFIKDSETDHSESIIITQKMADHFGWDKPLGTQIIWRDSVKLFVVGIIRDIYTEGLWHEMEPMMVRYVRPEEYNQIVVSMAPGNVAAVNKDMKVQWSKVFPNRIYSANMMGAALQEVDDLNAGIMSGYAFLGAFALLLSVTGLYTLVSLNIIKRMKEIGVRKIMGASAINISGIVNKEFVIILAIASVLGAWIGYTWCNVIMSTIWKYYQGVNTLTFVGAVGLVIVVSLATIGYKVLSVSAMDPVKTLRDE